MRVFGKTFIAAAATLSVASAANATVSVSVAAGCTVYCGPTPITYDFNSPTGTPSFVGGLVVGPGTTSGAFAQPVGSTGQYYSVGPSTSTPGVITLGSNIGSFSFIWGSIDLYNTLTLITSGGTYVYNGATIAGMVPASAAGSQVLGAQNPIVTFFLTGLDQAAVQMSMSSTQNAFEIDDIAVNGVPEPATWAMMLLGFGALGLTMRRRKTAEIPQLA